MKLQKFKEKNNKQKSIMIFTIACILLITGVFLYKTFAIFETNMNQDMINGEIQDIGDLEFAFYKEDEEGKDKLVKEAPGKSEGYSLDTSSSYCKDMTTGSQVSNVTWDSERWGPFLANVSKTKTKCYLYFKKIYQESTLNGAIPDLMNGRLVPVVISENTKPTDVTYVGAQAGKVTKADITNTNEPWYSYAKKQWANAVILRDGVTDHYKAGEEIKESDIESYFVWIPRYQYKLQNNAVDTYKSVTPVGNVDNVSAFYSSHANQATNNGFEIEFVSKEKQNTIPQGTIIHPAFEAFDSNGFWVGKFETGYNQNDTNDNVAPNDSWNTGGAEKNEDKGEKVIIKPNVYSWRSIQVANAFYTSYNYKRELESHMMKNTEWGAVAYLTQSKYGRCEANGSCTEMNQNNSEYYITGMSTTKAPTCGYPNSKEECNYYGGPSSLTVLESGEIKSYYLTASENGSTTGNYSGIYDMSGGAWEYVMGVMQGSATDANPASGRNNTYNSGFNGKFTCPTCDSLSSSSPTELTDGKSWPSSKYYDLYDYSTSNQEYQRGHLGDGTKEFGPFYSVSYISKNETRQVGSYNADLAGFVYSGNPWFVRGGSGHDGTDAGVSAFADNSGHASSVVSFRVVLTP